MAELTRYDVMALARHAGFIFGLQEYADGSGAMPFIQPASIGSCLTELERFAQLIAAKVRADEREECAKVCEGRIGGAVQRNEWWIGFRSAVKQCAAAIRARGNS